MPLSRHYASLRKGADMIDVSDLIKLTDAEKGGPMTKHNGDRAYRTALAVRGLYVVLDGCMPIEINYAGQCAEELRRDRERLDWLWWLRLAAKRLVIMVGLGPRLIEYCNRCGKKQPLVWWADNEMFAYLNGGSSGALCPACFDRAANDKGLLLRWRPELAPNICVEPNARKVDCAICGAVVSTCEKPFGPNYTCPEHPNGVECLNGAWCCSAECWELLERL